MTKQERKKFKKTKAKDRILLQSKPNALRHLGAPSDKSKSIKKGFQGKKNIITEQSVRQKVKSHRLVVPTSKLK